MWCGGEPLVVGGGGSLWPFASLCCWHAVLSCHCVVVSPCCHHACVVAPASGVRQARLKDSCTYLNSLDSDNGMHCHCLDNVAHLPCHLHHPPCDVALPHCCCSWPSVSWGLWQLLMARDSNERWRQWWCSGSGGHRQWWWLEWKHCLFVDNDKLSIGMCQCSIYGWLTNNMIYLTYFHIFQYLHSTAEGMLYWQITWSVMELGVQFLML